MTDDRLDKLADRVIEAARNAPARTLGSEFIPLVVAGAVAEMAAWTGELKFFLDPSQLNYLAKKIRSVAA